MAKGMGWGEGFSWPGDLLARLPEEDDPGAVFSLQGLDDNLVRRHPGPPDAPVFGPHQSEFNHTLDVSTRPGLGFLPLLCKTAGYNFQGSRCLHTQHPINGGNGGQEVSALLEA